VVEGDQDVTELLASGLADLVLPPSQPSPPLADLTALVHQTLPKPFAIPTNKLVDGTWELVVALKYFTGTFRSAQLLAERLSQAPQDGTATRQAMLTTSSQAYRMLEPMCSTDPDSAFYCKPVLWKNAGVVEGSLAKELLDRSDAITSPPPLGENEFAVNHEINVANKRMFRLWMRFVDEAVAASMRGRQRSNSKAMAQGQLSEQVKRDIGEVVPMLRESRNPFMGMSKAYPWLEQWKQENAWVLESVMEAVHTAMKGEEHGRPPPVSNKAREEAGKKKKKKKKRKPKNTGV